MRGGGCRGGGGGGWVMGWRIDGFGSGWFLGLFVGGVFLVCVCVCRRLNLVG